MRINRRTGIIAGLSALALATGAGAAGAAIASSGPISSSGVISGCYTTRATHGSHSVALQDAGTKCPRGTTAVTWNQKGATGPAGGTQELSGPANAAIETDTVGPYVTGSDLKIGLLVGGGTYAFEIIPVTNPGHTGTEGSTVPNGKASGIDVGIVTVQASSNEGADGGTNKVTGCLLDNTGGPNKLTVTPVTTRIPGQSVSTTGGATTGGCEITAAGVTAFVPLVTPLG